MVNQAIAEAANNLSGLLEQAYQSLEGRFSLTASDICEMQGLSVRCNTWEHLVALSSQAIEALGALNETDRITAAKTELQEFLASCQQHVL